jgi:hypothetical protein
MRPRNCRHVLALFFLSGGCLLVGFAGAGGARSQPGVAQSAAGFTFAADVNVITGSETSPQVTQNESSTWAHGSTVVVVYNDSSGATLGPASNCGVSVSTDAGATFTRLPYKFNQGGVCYGAGSVFYSVRAGRWFASFLTSRCGGKGIGQWESPDGIGWINGNCVANGTTMDRPTSWVDNYQGSAFYGRQYVAFNDFSINGGAVRLTNSPTDGTTWSTTISVSSAPFRRAVKVIGSLNSSGFGGRVMVQMLEEGGGGLNGLRTHLVAVSGDGGATVTAPTQQSPPTLVPGRVPCSDDPAVACMYTSPNGGYWRETGEGQPGVGPGGVMHYVFSARAGSDPGDIYYVRSTDNGLTWTNPLRLNTDGTTRAQWSPSLSVNAMGRLFVSWYDERNTVDDSLQRFGRGSQDNGATWTNEVALSNVIFAKPLQPDASVAGSYVGLHNHAAFSDDNYGEVAYHTWTDGRVVVNGQPQQDIFCKPITFNPARFVVTTANEHSDGVCDADCSLWDSVNAANANMTNYSIITFAPGVTGTITTALQNTGLNIIRPVTIIGPGARNLAINGGGTGRIFNISATANAKMSGLTLANGKTPGSDSPDGYGGAIVNAGSLSLSECTISDSMANVHGGAIYNNGVSGNASLSLRNCTLTGNSAALSGGAIFSAAYGGRTTLDLTNCTFNLNTAAQYGGALYNDGTGNGNASAAIANCTFTQNSASIAGGGVVTDGQNPSTSGVATVTLRNTIFHTGASGVNLLNDGGTVTSQGHNLSDDSADGPSGTAPGGLLNGTGDIRNTNPQLQSLANNGGPTDTAGLTSTSPARDTGNSANAPTTDQRGYVRSGASDIGAFEFAGTAAVLKILSITHQANGDVMLQAKGAANSVHTIQAASDPGDRDFTSIDSATANGSGKLQYNDGGAGGLTKRFYRVIFP